jgi:hypothetical protein
MKSVDKDKWIGHRIRADSFFEDMRFLEADDKNRQMNRQKQVHKQTIALLAVHASIALADAVLVAYLGLRSNDQDHRTVVKSLAKLCGDRRVPQDGINRLSWLLGRKTDFAYSDRQVLEDEAKAASINAERFVTWVNNNFREVIRNDAQ